MPLLHCLLIMISLFLSLGRWLRKPLLGGRRLQKPLLRGRRLEKTPPHNLLIMNTLLLTLNLLILCLWMLDLSQNGKRFQAELVPGFQKPQILICSCPHLLLKVTLSLLLICPLLLLLLLFLSLKGKCILLTSQIGYLPQKAGQGVQEGLLGNSPLPSL